MTTPFLDPIPNPDLLDVTEKVKAISLKLRENQDVRMKLYDDLHACDPSAEDMKMRLTAKIQETYARDKELWDEFVPLHHAMKEKEAKQRDVEEKACLAWLAEHKNGWVGMKSAEITVGCEAIMDGRKTCFVLMQSVHCESCVWVAYRNDVYLENKSNLGIRRLHYSGPTDI